MIKQFLSVLVLAMGVSVSYAQTSSSSYVYESSKIQVSYKGELGSLLQRLAGKLDVPFYMEKANPSVRVQIHQKELHSIKDLLTQLNQQLSGQKISFDILNDKVILVLVGDGIEKMEDNNFIGELVKYEPEPHPVAEITEKASAVLSDEQRQERSKKIEDILAQSQDEKVLVQYAKRAQPLYEVPDKEALGLEAIRSTKISTFLVFKNAINVEDFLIEGDFQEMVKLDNIVAILHRQKRPPKTITITTPQTKQVIKQSN